MKLKAKTDRVRLYVTAPEGRYIPGVGSRECGEFFEVGPGLADLLRDVPGLSAEAPQEAAAPETAAGETEHD